MVLYGRQSAIFDFWQIPSAFLNMHAIFILICDSITSMLSSVQNIYDPESQVCDATNIGDPGSERIYVCDTVLQPYGMSRVCVTNISTSICDIISVYAIRQQEVLNRRLKQYRIYLQSISKIFLLSNIATFGVSLCHLECI